MGMAKAALSKPAVITIAIPITGSINSPSCYRRRDLRLKVDLSNSSFVILTPISPAVPSSRSLLKISFVERNINKLQALHRL